MLPCNVSGNGFLFPFSDVRRASLWVFQTVSFLLPFSDVRRASLCVFQMVGYLFPFSDIHRASRCINQPPCLCNHVPCNCPGNLRSHKRWNGGQDKVECWTSFVFQMVGFLLSYSDITDSQDLCHVYTASFISFEQLHLLFCTCLLVQSKSSVQLFFALSVQLYDDSTSTLSPTLSPTLCPTLRPLCVQLYVHSASNSMSTLRPTLCPTLHPIWGSNLLYQCKK